MNNLTAPAGSIKFYFVSSRGSVTTDRPSVTTSDDSIRYFVFVMNWYDAYRTQLVFEPNELKNKVYVRSYNGNVWSVWNEL